MNARLLTWIAVWAAALAAGAVVLDWFERNRESPELVGRTLLGGVDLKQAGIVLIETAQGQVTLRRTAWGWVVTEQHDFPADMAKLRTLLLRLGQVRIAQRVLARPRQLAELGLLEKVENDWRFEAGRTAAVLSVIHGLDNKHKLMYQLLVGKRRDGAGTYVRFPGDGRVYLVAENLTLEGDAGRWIRRSVFADGAAERMQRVRIVPSGESPLTFARAAAGAPWQLAGAAPPLDAEQIATLVRTLARLRIRSVGAAHSAAVWMAGPAATIDVQFFDGRRITLALRRPGGAEGTAGGTREAALSAALADAGAGQAAAGPPRRGDARWRVETFNRHFAGRAVRLDAAQSGRLLAGRSTYLGSR